VVVLPTRRREAALSRLAAIEVALNLLGVDRQARRTALHDHTDAAPVGLAERRDPECLAEGAAQRPVLEIGRVPHPARLPDRTLGNIPFHRGIGVVVNSRRHSHEPAGYQEVWHYHLHVFPRYPGDDLYSSRKERVSEALRAQYAARLRDALPSRID
jgi:hypothetical protein